MQEKYKKPIDQCIDCKWNAYEKNVSFCDRTSGDFARYGLTETKFCGYFKKKEDTKNG